VEIGEITVVWRKIDTWVVKKMMLDKWQKEGRCEGRRGVRCGGYRVIRP
jgi:hypothetical protein